MKRGRGGARGREEDRLGSASKRARMCRPEEARAAWWAARAFQAASSVVISVGDEEERE